MTMVGDSADPIIASAFAFGANRFDRRAALDAMLRGATQPCASANGEYVERQGLAEYLRLGYVPFDIDTNERNANAIGGSPNAVWGSAATSLEYTVDDFAIAQFAARALNDRGAYRALMRRSATWRRLYDHGSGLIEPRYASGAFPEPYDNLNGGGFVEGDSYQYTWMVPQDPAGLFRLMGGAARAADRLDSFLGDLNGSTGATHTSHALLGNEPTLQTPWLYDWARRPYRTQAVVRRALRLYRAGPDGYPGNDDLGTLSAWYVFSALGLYPEVPGVGVLATGSPLFGRAEVRLPHRRKALITARAYAFHRVKVKSHHGKRPRTRVKRIALSPAQAPYVRSLALDGKSYGQPWTTYCALSKGIRLAYQLGPHPDRGWGDSRAATPPSYGPRRAPPSSDCGP
jgi:predicted alpha-1,2-mannosidase